MIRLRNKTSIYFADFETLTINSNDYKNINHTDVFLWYLENKDDDYGSGAIGYSLDEFMEFLKADKKSKIVYFHNLSFDGNFIYKWLKRNMINYYKFIGSPKPRGTYWEVFKNNNKYYYITINYKTSEYVNGRRVGRKFYIKFMCTFNLLSSSIDALGKSLKINKIDNSRIDELIKLNVIKNVEDFYNAGSLDFKNRNDLIKDTFIEYIKRDVRIAKESYINFVNNIDSLDEVYNRKYKKKNVNVFNTLTIASLSQKLCKNHILNEGMNDVYRGFYIKSPEMYKLAKNFYGGGITQFNTDYHNKDFYESGVGIDINSSYPFQMTKLLPYGELMEEKPDGDYLEYYHVKIKSAIIKQKYRHLICLKNWKKSSSLLYRYVKILDQADVYYFKDEWEIIKKIYDVKIESIKVYYAKASRWLSKFINRLYYFKTHYKQIGQEANSVSYKILLNSLYGSFCKRMDYDVVGFFNEAEKKVLMEKYRNDKLNNEKTEIYIGGESYYINGDTQQDIKELELYGIRLIENKEKDKLPNVLIGATITAYGRVQLLSTIIKLGTHNFIYCDTDSIFVKNYTRETIKKYVEMDDYDIGKWSLDFEFTRGRILGAKRYGFKNGDKVKFGFCGIHKSKVNKDNWDKIIQSDITIEDGILQRQEDDYGIILVWKDYITKIGLH